MPRGLRGLPAVLPQQVRLGLGLGLWSRVVGLGLRLGLGLGLFEACLQSSFPNKYAHPTQLQLYRHTTLPLTVALSPQPTSPSSIVPYIRIPNLIALYVTRYEHIKRIAEERVAELKKITVRGLGLGRQ